MAQALQQLLPCCELNQTAAGVAIEQLCPTNNLPSLHKISQLCLNSTWQLLQ
jgi:hypothetical protein